MFQGPHPLATLNAGLADMAVLQQLVQAFQVFDVAGKVIEEHDVEKNAHDLCQRRFLLIGNLDLMFLIFTADPDCENLLAPSRMIGLRGC